VTGSGEEVSPSVPRRLPDVILILVFCLSPPLRLSISRPSVRSAPSYSTSLLTSGAGRGMSNVIRLARRCLQFADRDSMLLLVVDSQGFDVHPGGLDASGVLAEFEEMARKPTRVRGRRPLSWAGIEIM